MSELKDKLEEFFLKILEYNIAKIKDETKSRKNLKWVATITNYVKFLIKSGVKDTNVEDVTLALYKKLKHQLQKPSPSIDPITLLLLNHFNKDKPEEKLLKNWKIFRDLIDEKKDKELKDDSEEKKD